MDLKEVLKPRQNVEIVVPDGPYKGRYRSQVDEVGAKVLSVATPYVNYQAVPLREGTELTVSFYDEISAYSFKAKIMQRIAVPVPVFVLEVTSEINKVQRRNFVRIPAFYPVRFRMVNKAGLSDLKKGYMLDLSGGGMCFHTEEKVENSALLFTHLELPNGEIQTPARVCRVSRDEENKRYVLSVEFYDISEKDRDKIVNCVFNLQRSMIRKGLTKD